MILPMAMGPNLFVRAGKFLSAFFKAPFQYLQAIFTRDFARHTTVLLFMQHLDSTLRIKKGRLTKMKTTCEEGPKPSAFIPRAAELAQKYEGIVQGKSFVGFPETLMGIPSTAHILGGAVMGKDPSEGVIDADNRVFGYQNMYVCDGSMISANPGVNPSLSITAISERAISKVPASSF